MTNDNPQNQQLVLPDVKHYRESPVYTNLNGIVTAQVVGGVVVALNKSMFHYNPAHKNITTEELIKQGYGYLKRLVEDYEQDALDFGVNLKEQ